MKFNEEWSLYKMQLSDYSTDRVGTIIIYFPALDFDEALKIAKEYLKDGLPYLEGIEFVSSSYIHPEY